MRCRCMQSLRDADWIARRPHTAGRPRGTDVRSRSASPQAAAPAPGSFPLLRALMPPAPGISGVHPLPTARRYPAVPRRIRVGVTRRPARPRPEDPCVPPCASAATPPRATPPPGLAKRNTSPIRACVHIAGRRRGGYARPRGVHVDVCARCCHLLHAPASLPCSASRTSYRHHHQPKDTWRRREICVCVAWARAGGEPGQKRRGSAQRDAGQPGISAIVVVGGDAVGHWVSMDRRGAGA